MSPLILASVVVLSAAPIKLAAPGLGGVNVDDGVRNFFSDHFAQQLSLRGLRVTTATEIQSLLGLERQKELLGCADQSQSCIAELANALGVDGLVQGSIGKFGDAFQINLKIVGATDARPLSVYSATASSDKEVLSTLTGAAAAMAPQVAKALGRELPADVVVDAGPQRGGGISPLWSYGLGAVGAVAGVGSLFFALSAKQHADWLNQRPITDGDPQVALSHRNDGERAQQNAIVLGSVAVVAAAAAIGLRFVGGGDEDVVLSVAPTNGGAAAVLTGELP